MAAAGELRAGTAGDVQHARAGRHELPQVVHVRRERREAGATVVEPRPLALAVLVVEGGGALGVPAEGHNRSSSAFSIFATIV